MLPAVRVDPYRSRTIGSLLPAGELPMDPTVSIRDAGRDDIDLLAGFAAAMAWETEHKRLDPAVVRRGVAAVIEHPPRGRYLLAEADGAALGTLMLTFEWSDWRAADWWWIQSVYIAPAARRRGVFRQLYAYVLAQAERCPDVCGLRLYVEHDNRAAHATYAALGMRDAGYRMLEHALPWVAGVIGKESG
jgi:GNAT superfamily N-acetyltransferase